MIHSSDRAAWLAARRELVGASEVAAMLGENPYCSRDQLRMEKAGLAAPFEGSEATDIALELEPFVLEMARKRWGWLVEPDGALHHDYIDPRLGATPDARMVTPWGVAVVQIKVTAAQPQDAIKPTKSGKPSTAAFAAGPPLYWQLQTQAEMAVTCTNHAVLLVLHTGPLALRSYYVPYHAGAVARIRAEVPKFWAEVEALRKGEAA